jgi:DNA-binding GntR family transcriptional regulator
MAAPRLDMYSDVPLYEQLAAILRERIRTAQLKPK